jgi:hypothetical protein
MPQYLQDILFVLCAIGCFAAWFRILRSLLDWHVRRSALKAASTANHA